MRRLGVALLASFVVLASCAGEPDETDHRSAAENDEAPVESGEALAAAPTQPANKAVKMHRLYQPAVDQHVYTTSQGEYLHLTRTVGLNDEGIGFFVFESKGTGMVPVLRLYNPSDGQHYYTVNEGKPLNQGEVGVLIGWGWKYEKVEGYLYPKATAGSREIFRLVNTKTSDHIYLSNRGEADAIIRATSGVWKLTTSLGFGPNLDPPARSKNYRNVGGTIDDSPAVPYDSANCTPSFPYQDTPHGTWLGGDTNFSYPLTSSRSVWTFQDTYVGQPGNMNRLDATLYGNTLAISDCVKNEQGVWEWRISYKLGRKPFFAGGINPALQKLWLSSPFMADGKLYYVGAIIEEGGPFGKLVGTKLIRINNPRDADPYTWRIDTIPLVDGDTAMGCGTIVWEDYAYFYGCKAEPGFYQNGRGFFGDVTVSRVKLSDLAVTGDARFNIATLDRDGRTWAGGFNWTTAKKLGIGANGGLSVRYNAELKNFQMFYRPNHLVKFTVQRATNLTGPWSELIELYKPPQADHVLCGPPEPKPNDFCYGAYEHPEFERNLKNRLSFTYTCHPLTPYLPFDTRGRKAGTYESTPEYKEYERQAKAFYDTNFDFHCTRRSQYYTFGGKTFRDYVPYAATVSTETCSIRVKGTCSSFGNMSNTTTFDEWGMQNQGAGRDAAVCARRAHEYARACGAGAEVDSIFGLTGKVVRGSPR